MEEIAADFALPAAEVKAALSYEWARSADVVAARWYVDADTLGLARILIQVRRDVTFPGDDGQRSTARSSQPPSPVKDRATPDDIWIPWLLGQGWQSSRGIVA